MEQHATKCKANNPIYECDCDGYHTWDELYEHRIVLWIALCRVIQQELSPGKREAGEPLVWRSKKHFDGELCFGTGTQFVLGIKKQKGEQITYHIPIEKWEATDFAETLNKAPEFDGHTSDDVLERIKKL